MLARIQNDIPEGEGWLYEPKWDGFRAIVFRDNDDVDIISRDKRPLERYFPELPPMLKDALPERCVVDGEILVARNGTLDFDALLQRIHPATSRITKLSTETPASFVAFDLLALGDSDVRQEPLAIRRTRLESVLGPALDEKMPVMEDTGVYLTPQTPDRAEAEVWFDAFESIGLEGLVAKQAGGPYVAGQRTMVKVKHVRSADVVIGGYRLGKSGDAVGALLLGVYDSSGVLHYVGHTSSFKAKERRELLERLHSYEGDGGFGEGRSPGGLSRWSGGREQTWVPLRPELVCEVAFDKLQGDRFRHAATFLRWRPDKPPLQCRFDQFEEQSRHN